jgi:hypothetical protein
MTKAERIFESTYRANRRAVRKGIDGIATLEYNDNDRICQRTINDLVKVWKTRADNLWYDIRMDAKHPENVDGRTAEITALEVETLRRVYLSIQRAEEILVRR